VTEVFSLIRQKGYLTQTYKIQKVLLYAFGIKYGW